MERSRFDIPLGESEGEALLPITVGGEGAGAKFENVETEERMEPITPSRERAAELGRLAVAEREPTGGMINALRSQRQRLRDLKIDKRSLARGAGAVAGAAMVAGFTAPAHPVAAAAVLAYGGAKLGEKLYDKTHSERR